MAVPTRDLNQPIASGSSPATGVTRDRVFGIPSLLDAQPQRLAGVDIGGRELHQVQRPILHNQRHLKVGRNSWCPPKSRGQIQSLEGRPRS